jgi:hypothetical protein
MSPASPLTARPRAYFNVDGLGELGAALFLLGYALIHSLQLPAPTLLLLAAAIHLATRAIKSRWTYPRTGFVEYRKRDTLWIPVLVYAPAAAILAVALSVALRREWNLQTLPAIFGALLTVSYAWGFARPVRWKWIVVLAMALASLYLALNPPADFAPKPMLLFGALLLVSGAVTLIQYIRTPPAQDHE